MGSGAWERETPSVLLAILTREIVTMKWALGLRGLALPAASGIKTVAGRPFDVARNEACDDALRLGFQWLMFLDDDVIPPGDIFGRLAGHGADVISGLYHRRQEPICPVAMVFNAQGQPTWVTSWNPPNSTVEVDLVGAGCLLIHRRVLEKVDRPWFEWEIGRDEGRRGVTPPFGGAGVTKDDKPQRNAMSEDFTFCLKAKRAGFRIYLDTSVHCEHVGLGQSSPDGTFRPSTLP